MRDLLFLQIVFTSGTLFAKKKEKKRKGSCVWNIKENLEGYTNISILYIFFRFSFFSLIFSFFFVQLHNDMGEEGRK